MTEKKSKPEGNSQNNTEEIKMTRTELKQTVEDGTYNLLKTTGPKTRTKVFTFVSEYGNLVAELHGDEYFDDGEAWDVVDRLEARTDFALKN